MDHISLRVSDHDAAVHFYEESLKVLGFVRTHNYDVGEAGVKISGFSPPRMGPVFWIAGKSKSASAAAAGTTAAADLAPGVSDSAAKPESEAGKAADEAAGQEPTHAPPETPADDAPATSPAPADSADAAAAADTTDAAKAPAEEVAVQTAAQTVDASESEAGVAVEKPGDRAGDGIHFAFMAPSVQAVQAWYDRAIELGARDNGKPGPRPQYHAGYYGAFVIDPDGWRLEAVVHNYRATQRRLEWLMSWIPFRR